ncbi:uncharacterized protein Z518_00963 [Rhinocladiella mackenziei CBS 650.93]|uniref:Cytochrome P450 n=1 Tax=Rhinocladiella mackenziei CBS 650.93 TaxID=1442369 RepID=A0A0D2G550_9EURO|nr:uncharacterized protein Z518_00963 [Rhinocladiella mackenziei CBS 650.93]KIX09882.1 hypothetical protein Z518_00963 [Rhinocladiella mackenziei CBS 650.93]
MWRIISAIFALLTAGTVYFVNLFYKKRKELQGLPQPPMESIFWGHLPLAIECSKLFPPDGHIQNWFHYIRKKYNLGDVFYLDWWPLGPRLLFIADPELTSKYITAGQSLPKSQLTTGYVNQLLGTNNMITAEGPHWKSLRSIFNPGFSASHLITLVPYMVDSSLLFLEILRERAKRNELISLSDYATRLTADIIGKVAMDSDFDSQKRPHPIMSTFRKHVSLMPSETSLEPLKGFNLIQPIRLWLNTRKLDALIGAEIDKRIEHRASQRYQANGTTGTTSGEKKKDRQRPIIHLALDANEKEVASQAAGKGSSSGSGMTKSFRKTAIDSIKTFIFAGHDNTSTTISYAMYLLHLHKEVHAKVLSELSSVFGPGFTSSSIAASIKADPHSINHLEYLHAVIKETLRIFSPGSTVRGLRRLSDISSAKECTFTDPSTGNICPLAGFDIWIVSQIIQRNESYFPDPINFVPERFIPSMTPYLDCKMHTPAGRDAWRPFEKGPRNCIGQELAMIEMKVVLALVVPEVDFTAEYDGKKMEEWTPVETRDEFADGIPGAIRLSVEGHKPFQVLSGRGATRGGMTGRLTVRR